MEEKRCTAARGSLLIMFWTGAELLTQLASALIRPHLTSSAAQYGWTMLVELSFLLIPLVLVQRKGAFAPLHRFGSVPGEKGLTGLAALLALAAYPAVAVLQNLWDVLLEWVGISPAVTVLPEIGGVFDLLLAFLALSVSAGFAEELCFRGTLLPAFRGRMSTAKALMLTAGLFALMHGRFDTLPYTFLLGLVMGFLALRSGSLYPALAFHMVNNGIAVLLTVLTSLMPAEATQAAREVTGTLRLEATLLMLPMAVPAFIGSLLLIKAVCRRTRAPEELPREAGDRLWWMPLAVAALVLTAMVAADLVGSISGGMACISILSV